MKKQALILASAAILSVASVNTYAESNGFQGAGEFGFTKNTGNTSSKTILGGLKLDYIQPLYEVRSAFSVNNKSEDGDKTQERYVADLQYNRFFANDKNFYGFVQTRFENDDFADLRLDQLYTVGIGKTLIKNDRALLKAEAGVGYQNVDYIQQADFDQMVARLKGDFTYKINEQMAFSQDAILYTGKDQNKVETNTGVKVRMATNLNLKAGFQYRYNSDPSAEPGVKKEDTQTTLTVIYEF